MKKWTMIVSALACLLLSCGQQPQSAGASGKSLSVTRLNKLETAENFTVTISRGSNYSVYATGSTDDLALTNFETSCSTQIIHD